MFSTREANHSFFLLAFNYLYGSTTGEMSSGKQRLYLPAHNTEPSTNRMARKENLMAGLGGYRRTREA